MPTVYIETTIPSYLVSEPSRDIIVLAHQQLTCEWWDFNRSDYDLFISQVVLDEISVGDPIMAARRLEMIYGIHLLPMNEDVERVADVYLHKLPIPPKAFRDALHLALAVVHKIDFIVTWNMKHLANATIVLKLSQINSEMNLHIPIICTPEELIEKNEGE